MMAHREACLLAACLLLTSFMCRETRLLYKECVLIPGMISLLLWSEVRSHFRSFEILTSLTFFDLSSRCVMRANKLSFTYYTYSRSSDSSVDPSLSVWGPFSS